MKKKQTSHHPSQKIKGHKKIQRSAYSKEWFTRAISFLGILLLLFGFGVFCWMVKEMARVGVLGISIAR